MLHPQPGRYTNRFACRSSRYTRITANSLRRCASFLGPKAWNSIFGVFVFTSKKYLDWFVNKGWDASAQADAAAKAAGKGDAWAGAVDVAPGIYLYQITEGGLALQATIQGTKYWRDSSLN